MIRRSSITQQENDNVPLPRIEARATNIKKDSIDCGITALGCCNTPTCQRLGTTKSFVSILVIVGILQGASEKYFVISAKQAAQEHNYSLELLDWLLVSNGIFQGILAIVISYWGNRIHRISWLGGIIILQAITSLAIIIPVLSHNEQNVETIVAHTVKLLCKSLSNLTVELPHSITTLVLFFVLQLGIALGNIAFYTLALSYIDDNVSEHNSPAIFGAVLGAKYWGTQWGSALSYALSETSFSWWLGWTILSPLLFILAICLSLFPKLLLSTIIRIAANNIVDEARNNSQQSISRHKFMADFSFSISMQRMFSNKILWFNIIAASFIEMAIFNYFYHEANYLESRFFLPAGSIRGISNEWTSRIFTNMLRPPIVALFILVSGLIISKAKPSSRKLAMWNVITAIIAILLFVAFIFIQCTHNSMAGAYNGKLVKPYCARNCLCDRDIRFMPVCPQDSVQTYYSPCHAGCASDTLTNGQRLFVNCSCGVDSEYIAKDTVATEGACGYIGCQKMWIIYQALTIAIVALLASSIIGKILISIRCVLSQDKSLALAMELTVTGLLVYIPGKISYQSIADATCQYWSYDNSICYLHETPIFENILNIVSASLIGIGAIFYILVYVFVEDLKLYGEDEDEYRPVQSPTGLHRYDSPANIDASSGTNIVPNITIPMVEIPTNTNQTESIVNDVVAIDQNELADKLKQRRNYENFPYEQQLDYNIKSSDDESSSDEASHIINKPARKLSKKYLESEVL